MIEGYVKVYCYKKINRYTICFDDDEWGTMRFECEEEDLKYTLMLIRAFFNAGGKKIRVKKILL